MHVGPYMLDWVQNVPVLVDPTYFLKFKWRYLPDSKQRWNHFNQLSRLIKQLSKVSVRWRSQKYLLGKFTATSFFISVGWLFLSRTLTTHRTAGEGGGYLFNSSQPLSATSQTLTPGRLLQRAHLCTQLAAALESRTFGFQT